MRAHFGHLTLRDLSIDIKSATSHGVLIPQNALWSFGSPFGTPTLTNSQHGSSLGSVRVHSLTLFALPGACDMTPGSTYRPATLQPPCLGREPRLGLRHLIGGARRRSSSPVEINWGGRTEDPGGPRWTRNRGGTKEHTPLPPFSARSRERPPSPNFPQLYIVGPLSEFNKGLGSASCAMRTVFVEVP
jgi:hypothetical protein